MSSRVALPLRKGMVGHLHQFQPPLRWPEQPPVQWWRIVSRLAARARMRVLFMVVLGTHGGQEVDIIVSIPPRTRTRERGLFVASRDTSASTSAKLWRNTI